MFCSKCGKEIAEEMRSCTNCGTQIAAVSPQQQYAPTGNKDGNSALLLGFKLVTGKKGANFLYTDANGKHISADILFNRNKPSVLAQEALFGLNNQGFGIKAEIYDNKICFIRLTALGLGKPTDDKFEINSNEIISVDMSNTISKRTITIVTHSMGKLKFAAPKKQIENIVQVINGLKRRR
jgi:hypothetical protein